MGSRLKKQRQRIRKECDEMPGVRLRDRRKGGFGKVFWAWPLTVKKGSKQLDAGASPARDLNMRGHRGKK